VDEGRPRFEASREERDRLAQRFFAAARDGEVDALEELLAEDVVLHGDGGGKVPALGRAVHGVRRVARTLAAWSKQGARIPGITFRLVEVNGQPGALSFDGDGNIINVMSVDIAGGRIQGIHSMVNPEKLRHLGPSANWAASRAPS
jgi:RNA polymerase sigma-70 factor (ECF subfamily)